MKAACSAFLVLLLGCALAARAEEISSVGPLPSARWAATVTGAERNPFAKKEEPKPRHVSEAKDPESEEGRIRAFFENLEVVGRARDDTGWKVLMGDFILVKGSVLPPVIAGQTYILQVVGISEASLEIEWTTPGSNNPPRRMLLPIRLTPTVRSRKGNDSQPATPVVITAPTKILPKNTDVFAVQD